MKLKLFIVMLIALSLAVTGLLGGCSGGKKNKDKQDGSIVIGIESLGQSTEYTCPVTADKKFALAGYDDDDNLIWLVVYKKLNDGYVSIDTLYVLSGVEGGNDQNFECYDSSKKDYVDFTATSSKSNIAKLKQLDSKTWSTTSYDETGEAEIHITTIDGRKTWFTVKVVGSVDDMPEFTPAPIS